MDLPTTQDVGLLSQIFETALQVFGRNAAVAAFCAAFVESLVGLGVIFPGGTVVILSGFAARAGGGAGFVEVSSAAWLGMTLGTVADYWLGRFFGRRLVPRRAPWRLACRWRHTLRVARGFMDRWGWWAIIAANLAGPGRSAVAVAAGASAWSFGSFLAGQMLASLMWSTVYCGVGFFVARESAAVEEVASSLALLVVVLVVAAFVVPALLGRLTGRAGRRAEPAVEMAPVVAPIVPSVPGAPGQQVARSRG